MAEYSANWVRSFYDQYGELEWRRSDAGPVEQVKLAVHLHHLREYIQPGSRVLEIGAGAGRFTQELVKVTERVVVADISPVQLELNRQNAERLGYAKHIEQWLECDMCVLQPHFRDAEFDAVVCYWGPLSYVLDQRERAMAELLRVARPGGALLLSVMSVWGTLHQYLPGVLAVDTDTNREIIATGDVLPEKDPTSQHRCHMFRAREFREFLRRSGAQVEVLSASNCLSTAWGDRLDAIQKEPARWQFLLEMEAEAGREPGCVDMGTHVIAVCRKPGWAAPGWEKPPRETSAAPTLKRPRPLR